jgi:capsid portal protein
MSDQNKKVFNIKADKIQDPSVPTRQEIRNSNTPFCWYGYDNLYPDFIKELFQKSAFNRTCLISKAIAVTGNGLKTVDPNEEVKLEQINPDESWNEVFEKVVLDYEIYGAFSLQIVWDRLGENIAAIYHIDVSKIRSGYVDPVTDRVEWYYVSSDWSRYKKAEYKPRAYKSFSPKDAEEYPSQILYYWDYYPGNSYYGTPSYSGSLTAISSDVEIDTFHLSNLKNGLAPSLWIEMVGDPGPEGRQQIYSEIASSFSGSESAGKFMLSWANGTEEKTTITPITAANDDYYLALQERLITTIMSGHRIVNPKMLGVFESSSGVQIGGRDQIMDSYQLFTQQVIIPDTKALLKPLNKLFKLFGGIGDLYVEPIKLFPEVIGGDVKDGGTDTQVVEEMA